MKFLQALTLRTSNITFYIAHEIVIVMIFYCTTRCESNESE